MNYTFDYAYMRDEMIDLSLRLKNQEMFIQLTSETYEDYIAQFLGFQDKEEFDVLLKDPNETKRFVQWIEENKYEYHTLVIRYLIEHPSLIDIEDDTSCQNWRSISTMLRKDLPCEWLYQQMKTYFNENVAEDFLAYIGMYKQK